MRSGCWSVFSGKQRFCCCTWAGTRLCKLNKAARTASQSNVQRLLRGFHLPSLGSSHYQHICGPLLISEMGPVSQTAFPFSMGYLRKAPTSHLEMGIAAPVAERGGSVAGLTPRNILLRVRPRFEDYSYHRWRLQLQTVQGRCKAGSNELAHSQRMLLSMNTSLK